MNNRITTQLDNQSFVIFAAQPNPTEDVMDFLANNNIPFKVLLGVYKGEKETSYIVEDKHLTTLIQAGILEQQESILILEQINAQGFRPARIVYLSAGPEALTESTELVFAQVGRHELVDLDGWTFDPSTFTYYTLKQAA